MPRILSDNDFRRPIVRGLTRLLPDLDAISLRQAGLAEQPDDVVLRFALTEERIVLTHDVSTMTAAVRRLVEEGYPRARVVLVPQAMPTGPAIEDLLIVLRASTDADWDASPLWLPL